ncbi:uncharacterized protein VTP21DRAFT_867 [Calcarisporiella thermophila]|uniref:uncharacterized protein n=1 Tax=Calcarisporiella thermophila TaxID=911321 RepID=UPI0037433984
MYQYQASQHPTPSGYDSYSLPQNNQRRQKRPYQSHQQQHSHPQQQQQQQQQDIPQIPPDVLLQMQMQMQSQGGGMKTQNYDGKQMRKRVERRTVNYASSVGRYLQDMVFTRDHRDRKRLRPDPAYVIDLLSPCAYLDNPMNAITTKWVHTSTNKQRFAVNVARWTPEGRRLVTGSFSGEFTLWNGLTFNFETILQAHDSAVRAMRWSHNDTWMVTGDHGGFIKYWQSNMNNLKVIQGHREPVRDITFSPSDARFASCSDDGTIKIWNFNEGIEERTLTGHGWDVKCVDWHPYKGLLASGSKDNLVKLWDPKTGKTLTTLHGHKNTIQGLEWNKNGNWLATGGRDQQIKIYDIRMMREMFTFKGHKRDITSLAWHPVHERLLATGGSEGSLTFWLVGEETNVGCQENAHENNVWALDWHPLGHILVSGSSDCTTRFWTRNRPGDTVEKFTSGKAGPGGGDDVASVGSSGARDGDGEGRNAFFLPSQVGKHM